MIDRTEGIRAAEKYLFDKDMENTTEYQFRQFGLIWDELAKEIIKILKPIVNKMIVIFK